MNDKLMALANNEEFKEKMLKLETVEQIQALFADYDVTMSLDEVADFCKEIAKAANMLPEEANAELNEDELDNVAGGVITLAAVLGYAAYAGCVALGAYLGYQRMKNK